MCTSFLLNKKCRYGRKCLFAHGPQELRKRLSPPSSPQICLPVAMPMASLQAPYVIMPPLPPGPFPPHVYEKLPSKPLPPKPQPFPTLLQLVHPPLSDWSSLVKTIQELHKSIMSNWSFESMPKKAPWFFEESCLICLDNIPTHAFMPCKHVVVCQVCAPAYDRVKQKGCYKCREPADLVPFVPILCASI